MPLSSNRKAVRIIGACKCVYGILLIIAGFGLFHLLSEDYGTIIDHTIMRFHLDHKNHMSKVILLMAGMDEHQLKMLDAGTFFFAGMETIEGLGLFMGWHWAEYFTIIATSAFLIPECYEIANKMSLTRIVVFLINLAIVLFLVWQIRLRKGKA